MADQVVDSITVVAVEAPRLCGGSAYDVTPQSVSPLLSDVVKSVSFGSAELYPFHHA